MPETLQTTTLAPVTPEATGQPSEERKRILIVESDGFTRLVLIFLFRLAGFAVDFTSNVMLALGKLRATPPDALIVELKLPVVSGLELIREARRDPQFGNRPIYLFTARDRMSRAVQKEVQTTVTRIFDKRTTVVEDLLNVVVAELTGVPAPEPSRAEMTGNPTPELPVNAVVPGDIDEIISGVHEECDLWLASSRPGTRAEGSDKLLGRLRYLLSCAQAAGLRNLARQAKALEAFLAQCHEGGDVFSKEDLNTLRNGVDLLVSLSNSDASELRHFAVGIIDESKMSGGALSVALLKAGIKPISFEKPAQALTFLASNPVDLVIVNLAVPEFHGFDAGQIAQLPPLSGTPVIVVPEPTALRDADWAEPVATPLNANSRLLTGLIMRTLNRLQSPDGRRTPSVHVSPAPDPEAEQEAMPDPFGNATASNGASPISPPLKPWGQLIQARNKPAPIFERATTPPDLESAGLEEPEEGQHSIQDTILFVEDDAFVLKVYTRALERAGLRVEVARDGLEAFGLLAQIKPSLVVLDLMLPKVDGLEVLQFVRADSDLKDTPVIVLSNVFLGELADRARAAGANYGFSKSDCTPDRLVYHLLEILEHPDPGQPAESGFEGSEAVPLSTIEAVPQNSILAGQPALAQQREIEKIRRLCFSCTRAVNSQKSSVELSELYRRVRFLSARAALIGFTKIEYVSSALEGLLFELMFKQSQPASSTIQTIAQAVGFLAHLVQNKDTTFAGPRPEPKVLVVDGDETGNAAMVKGLQRGRFQAVGTHDPAEGIRMLESGQFDAITVDMNTPVLGGFETYGQLRMAPQHQSVPVIVFNGNQEPEDRASNLIPGGNDVLPKDACTLEVVLRLIIHTLKPAVEGLADNSCPRPLADTPLPAGDAASSWSVETDFNSEAAQAPHEQSAPEPTASPDSLGYQFAAAALSCESANGSEACETTQSEEEALSRESTGTATERSNDEPYGAIEPGAAPVSDIPDETTLEPAPKARATDNEWLANTAGLSAEAAPPAQGGAGSGAELNQSPSALDSNAPDAVDFRPLAQAKQAQSEGGFVHARVGAEPDLPLQSGVEDKTMRELTVSAPDVGPIEPDSGNDLANQLQSFQAEWAKQRQAIAKYELERESLINRLVNAENEMHRQGVALERKEEELAELRSSRDEHQEHPAGDDSNGSGKPADPLSQHAAVVEPATAQAEKPATEHEPVESDLRRKLEEAGAAAETNAAAHQEAQERCAQLEKELAESRKAFEDLNSQLTKEKQTGADSSARVKELENQLQSGKDQTADLEQGISQRVAALSRVTADLAKERGERHRSDERAAALNKRLQDLHADTKLLLESQRADQERIGQLEEQLRERDETLARQTAELEQQMADYRLAEEQLGKTSDLNADLNKHLSSFDVARKTLNSTQQELQSRLDAALNALEESGSKLQQENAERDRLATELEEARRELQTNGRKQESLETDLQTTVQALNEAELKLQQEAAERARLAAALDTAQRELQNKGRNRNSLETDFKAVGEALHETESRLQQETTERQRLAQALESAQRAHRDHAQRTELELSKAQCALQFEQVERERLVADVAHLRHASLHAERGTRLQRNAWRKQFQGPVDNLYKGANNLLQLEMNDEQKKLAEGLLENILMVQNTLQEPETPQSETAEPASKPAPVSGAASDTSAPPDKNGA